MYRNKRAIAGAGVVALAALVLVALAVGGVFSSGASADSPTAAKAPKAAKAADVALTTKVVSSKEQDPFGVPKGGAAIKDPAPPGEPTLAPQIATKTTTRLYGANPYEEAVSVTQHIWPAALPENAPNENNNDPDRPWGVTLVTPDDPLTAITATPLIHFPDDAPILYVNKNGIPAITLNELKRLGDTGISRYHNVDAFLVGSAANSSVERQLTAIGMKYVTVTASNIPQLADNVDRLYSTIEGGVPSMENGAQDVFIGSMDGKAYQYLLPATHWVAHMSSGLFWVSKNSVPSATIDALQRRNGNARIYLFGGTNEISANVAQQLGKYGTVIRITNDNEVAYNAPPKDNPVDLSIVFAKMWDTAGQVGWNIDGPGHGFTLVNVNDWQGAVASAPLSHLGFHAPLLLTDSATKLPSALDSYFTEVAPTFLLTPAEGPYNMTYAIGSWKQISWGEQARVDYVSEMSPRRLWSNGHGGRYSDGGQP